MAVTHFSDIAVGDRSVGVFGSAALVQRAVIQAIGTPVRLYFSEPTLIMSLAALNTAGIPAVIDFEVGRTPGGDEIGTGTTVVGEMTPFVHATAKGDVYFNQTGGIGTPPLVLYLVYATILL